MRAVAVVVLLVGCGPELRSRTNGDGGTGIDYDSGSVYSDNADFSGDPNQDSDKDGYTVGAGDCNDYDALVGPGAMEVVGNNVDDDCDGMVDEPELPCDSNLANKDDATSLAQAMGLCDPRVLKMAKLNAADASAAVVLGNYGDNYSAQEGSMVAVMSTGIAARKGGPGWVKGPQPGTDFKVTTSNPDKTVPVMASCGQTKQPDKVFDMTELELKLKVPQNARSFSFTFTYNSAEYPEYVCDVYNDSFLVELKSAKYPTFTNIAFDASQNPITINNGLFTVCDNWTLPQTKNCKTPGSHLAGSGYEDADMPLFGAKNRIGGATGWLTTTAPADPGEEITIRFIIFDQGDGVLDSSVVLDSFQWSLDAAIQPQTIP